MRLCNRHLCWGASLIAGMAIAPAASAQHRHLSAREVGQIANEVLRVVVPPEQELSGVAVSSRGLALDVKRTLAEFGAPAAADTGVRLKRGVAVVSQATVLADCSQMTPKPCTGLGSRVYVAIQPLSVGRSHAHVRATTYWAERRHFGAGTSSAHTAFMTGFSATVHLVRGADGVWVFERQDPSVIAF